MSDVEYFLPFPPKQRDGPLPGCKTPDVCAPSWKRYRQRWCSPFQIADLLRKKYRNDLAAYLADYSNTQCEVCKAPKEDRVSKRRQMLLRKQQSLPQRMRNREQGKLLQSRGEEHLELFLRALERRSICDPSIKPRSLEAGADFILVAIDFEFDGKNGASISEVGIATLDTRDLLQGSGGVVKSRNIITGTRRSFARSDKHYLFGDTEAADITNPTSLLRDVLHIADDISSDGALRNVIVVCYGAHSEINAMQKLGIFLDDMVNILGVLDVEQMAISRFHYSPGLRGVLNRLRVPYAQGSLHIAGNDAHYTLQAMLALACKGATFRERADSSHARRLCSEWSDWSHGAELNTVSASAAESSTSLRILQAIAYNPPPARKPKSNIGWRLLRSVNDHCIDWASVIEGDDLMSDATEATRQRL